MDCMKKSGILVGAGILLGAVGAKALTSKAAKKCYVQGVAKGMQAKSAYEGIVEQARAEVGDIVAEASYLNIAGRAGSPETACTPAPDPVCAPEPAGAPETAPEGDRSAPQGSK